MAEVKDKLLITGYSKGNGKVLHALVMGGAILCEAYKGDKARKLPHEPNHTAQSVTCAKCKRHALLKALLQAEGDGKPDDPKDAPAKPDAKQKPKGKAAVTAATAKPQQTTIPDPEPGKTDPQPDEAAPEIEQPKKQAAQKVIESKDVGHLPLHAIAAGFKNGQFITRQKHNQKFDIVHRRSDNVFFSDVEASAILNCLFMLNSVNVIWNGEGQPGGDYITLLRQVFKAAYHVSNLEYPIALDNAVPKTKPRKRTAHSLRRRQPKQQAHSLRRRKVKLTMPKQLKRRSKAKYIFRDGSPKAMVAKLLLTGPTPRGHIVTRLIAAFRINEKQAKEVLTKAINQLVRVKGYVIKVKLIGPHAEHDTLKLHD